MKEIQNFDSDKVGWHKFPLRERGGINALLVCGELLPQTNSTVRSANPEMYEWLMENTVGEIGVRVIAVALDPHTFEPIVGIVLYLEDPADSTAFALRWS